LNHRGASTLYRTALPSPRLDGRHGTALVSDSVPVRQQPVWDVLRMAGEHMFKHIIFDVNETLLDLAALDRFFTDLFGDSAPRTEWFLTLQECWMTANLTEAYQPFSELAQAALRRTGVRYAVQVTPAHCKALAETLVALPPHPDVYPALTWLKESGCVLIALTNGSLESVGQQLQAAGLADCFDHVLAASEVKRFKPAIEAYQLVAQRLQMPSAQLLMVAAHAWDIAGAAHAGCRTAFVARPGKAIDPLGRQPDLQGPDLKDIARQILALRA
jgi:2-haloacid dehalogenase